MTVKNTGIKNFGVGTCTFVDLFDAECIRSWTGGVFEFMQTVKRIIKSPYC